MRRGRRTETFAIIVLHKNVMAEKNQCSALQLRTDYSYTTALYLFGGRGAGIKYQGAAHSGHGTNFIAQSKEQIY